METDGQTDGQTDGRTTCNLNTALCTSASRGKNEATDVVSKAASSLVKLALSSEPDSFHAVNSVLDREWTVGVLKYKPLGLSLIAARLAKPLQTFSAHQGGKMTSFEKPMFFKV